MTSLLSCMIRKVFLFAPSKCIAMQICYALMVHIPIFNLKSLLAPPFDTKFRSCASFATTIFNNLSIEDKTRIAKKLKLNWFEEVK